MQLKVFCQIHSNSIKLMCIFTFFLGKPEWTTRPNLFLKKFGTHCEPTAETKH